MKIFFNINHRMNISNFMHIPNFLEISILIFFWFKSSNFLESKIFLFINWKFSFEFRKFKKNKIKKILYRNSFDLELYILFYAKP